MQLLISIAAATLAYADHCTDPLAAPATASSLLQQAHATQAHQPHGLFGTKGMSNMEMQSSFNAAGFLSILVSSLKAIGVAASVIAVGVLATRPGHHHPGGAKGHGGNHNEARNSGTVVLPHPLLRPVQHWWESVRTLPAFCEHHPEQLDPLPPTDGGCRTWRAFGKDGGSCNVCTQRFLQGHRLCCGLRQFNRFADCSFVSDLLGHSSHWEYGQHRPTSAPSGLLNALSRPSVGSWPLPPQRRRGLRQGERTEFWGSGHARAGPSTSGHCCAPRFGHWRITGEGLDGGCFRPR